MFHVVNFAISQEILDAKNKLEAELVGEVTTDNRYISLTRSGTTGSKEGFVFYFKNLGFPEQNDYCLVTFEASRSELDLIYLAFRERFTFEDSIEFKLHDAFLKIAFMSDPIRIRVVVIEEGQPMKWTDLKREEVDRLFKMN
ncbi:hypothetical protein BST85_05005 [Aureitalea marina]|uniref:Uncharacterized protein n=1 Tax=Aureitalea marina TaxID=930804 RepID=A0A2S7KNZ5_9FLAO|nr:hypothetical protein BST85_05005 [Aureitalea marina]